MTHNKHEMPEKYGQQYSTYLQTECPYDAIYEAYFTSSTNTNPTWKWVKKKFQRESPNIMQ
jgi:hypothetical protein